MMYQQMPHQFLRFDDCVVNVNHIVEAYDDAGQAGHVTIVLTSGGIITVPGSAKELSDICGLDVVDYKPSIRARN